MAADDTRVCPRCGAPAGASDYCASCGLALATLDELPTKLEWDAGRAAFEPQTAATAVLTTEQPIVSSAPQSLTDVQPILERSGKSIWSQAETVRDDLCKRFEDAVEREGYRALVIKSGPFEQPAQVRLESWMPRGTEARAITARRSVVVTIVAREFHRYPLEYTVELHDGAWSKTYGPLSDLPAHDDARLVQFVLDRAPAPNLNRLRLRQGTYDVWRPKNKVTVLQSLDWLAVSPRLLAILGVILLLFGFSGSPALIVLGLLLLAAAYGARYVLRRRRMLVRTSGKPQAEPRRLSRVDSWQAVVSGLGEAAELLRSRLLALMNPAPIEGMESRVEQIWYWGLDGTVERTQVVSTLRRAWVFCQIYAYDDELYVGWDAHLNSGQWVEKTVATGVDKATGRLTQVNTVESGVQTLNEYDVIDLNCISEWTHARLVQLVQQLMDERKIEQEIDFTIIRGDRARATRAEGTGSEASESGARAAVGRRLKRIL